MNINDVNAVLDAVEDKLGIVADNSTEMMQKIVHYRIMVNAVGVIALAFLVLRALSLLFGVISV